MGSLVRALDWSATPLGPVEDWPQSLLTSVSTCLDCAFPILIWWGPELVMIYNDEYRTILGSQKHPKALGAAGRAIWPEIWDVIGPMLSQVVSEGVATRSRDLLLLMDRFGYEEETYFSFSYSPIRAETGGVGGVFTPVIETTAKVVGERRLATLRELAARPAAPVGLEAAARSMAEVLAANAKDVPFALIYGADSEAGGFRLLAAAGVAGTGFAPPPALAPGEAGAGGEILGALDAAEIRELPAELFGPSADLPKGAWTSPPSRLLLLPITPPGREEPAGLLISGVNPKRPLDAEHMGFFELLRGQVGKVFADALAFEEERRRTEALAEIDRAKTTFFSNISHEFRTPLTLMLGALETLLGAPDLLPEEARGEIVLAHRSALRLLRLVNDLLDFSRIEAGRIEAAFAPADLGALTLELASAFRSVVEQAGLTLAVEARSLPEPVFVDSSLWEKVVLNLLSNAFKFTHEGGITLTVAPDAEGRGVVVSVRDTGVGVPASELPRLFERFHRAEGTRGRSFEGSGIGLAMTHEIVALHGGVIEVDSVLGEGTEFRVRLPFGTAHLPADLVSRAAAPTASQRLAGVLAEAEGWRGPAPAEPAQGGAAPRVLIADDNRDMRGYLERLIRTEGLEVETAANGAEALRRARARTPALIVSDIMMPELDGLGLLEALREEPGLKEVPVILLSARAGENERIAGVEAGADDYVAKPFAARELMARVRTQLTLRNTRLEARDAIVRSERLLRLAQSAGRISAWELDLDARTLRASPAAPGLWGAADGARLDDVLDAVDPEDRRETEAAFARAISGEGGLDIEVRARTAGSTEVRWHALRAERLDEAAGRRLVGVSFDVTARRRAEAELRNLNRELERRVSERTAERDRIWRLATDIMLIADFEGTIQAANPAFTAVLGWPQDVLLGRSFLDFVHPDDREETQGAIGRLAEGAVVLSFLNRYLARDGEVRWVSWSARTEGPSLYAVGRDVTQERQDVDALKEAQEQLQQAQKMEAIGQLTGGVAHDFNNLLTVIRGSADLLRRPDLPEERRRAYAEAIVETSERAANLTRQLLAFSRRQLLNPEPFEAMARIRGVTAMLQTVLGSRITLTLQRTGASFVVADPTQFETALVNLLVNARDAMEGAGAIAIDVVGPEEDAGGDPQAGFVSIRVADRGVGIAPEHLARVFDPFFTTKPVGKGTGLGLSQVFGFATQSGGEIAVESAPGRGTVFTLRLPAAAPGARVEAERRPAPDLARLTGARILVVDDNPEIGAFAAQLLRELGAEPVLAASGEEALARLDAREEDFDLVFSDIVMPGLSGLELREVLSRSRPELPVVLTTGYSHTLAAEGLAAGDVVHKPYAVNDVADALGRVLKARRRKGAAEDARLEDRGS